MNYDATYYYTLTPLVIGLTWYAGSVLAAAVVWHWIKAAFRGAVGNEEALVKHGRDAGLALLLFILFYVPVPNPGQVIGFRDDDVQIEKTEYGRTTVAIFALERLSYGVDDLMRAILSWDVTIQALARQNEEIISGEAATVRTSRAPSSADVIYSFIIMRAQFVTRYYRQLWRPPDEQPPQEVGSEDDSDGMNVFAIIKNLSGPQRMEFITKQLSQWFYSLVASMGLILFIIVFMLVALVLFAVAGLVKYAAIFLMAVFLLCFPIAYFLRGTAVLKPALGQVGVFVLVKGAVILIVWIGFFLIEAVMLQGLRELAVDDHLVSNFAARAEPGFIYTDAGSSLLFAAETGEQLARGQTASTKTLVSFLVILLAMLYVVIKLPAYIGAMMGTSGGEDAIMTPAFVAAMAASAGLSLAAKGGDPEPANKMARGG